MAERLLWVISFGLLVDGTQIISVIDSQRTEYNPHLEGLFTPNSGINTDMNVVISNETQSIVTFEQVCQHLKKGALMLFDMSAPAVGPLLRSFARAHGLVLMTGMDGSILLPVDEADEFHIKVQPPGAAMLKVIADIVTFEKFNKVAVLYDKSFDLQHNPRNILSGVSAHHIYHEITHSKPEMRAVLQELADLEIENIFVIGASSSVDFILTEANSHKDIKTEEINWFVITKDAKVTCDGCYKKTRVVLIDGAHTFANMNRYVDFMRLQFIKWFQSLDLKVDEAFAYDMVRLLKQHMSDSLPLVTTRGCYDIGRVTNETKQNANVILSNFVNISYSGVFGQIIHDGKGIRQKIKLNIKRVEFSKGSPHSEKSLGVWTEDRGLNVSADSLIKEKSRKSYRVVVVPEYKPFIYKHTSTRNGTSSKYTYTGFCIDLFDKIAEELDFSYDIYETQDGFFGSLNDDGTWNGAINELMEKRADIAVGPISVMSERENVIDFTVPFHEPVGLTILMKKSKFEYSLHKFLSVLNIEVWGCIVASYFLFSILMWLFDKFSPYSYQNNPSTAKGPEKRVFTLKEGIWFCMTSLTPQGGGEAPKAVSGRLVAATWWLYGFLLIAFYTANLAAFLTVFRLETPITSLDDLTKQQSVQYGPMNGTAALVYFQRMQDIENQFYRIWKDMSLNDSLNPVQRAKLAVWDYPVSEQFTKLMDTMFVPNHYDEALNMVKTGKFAFIDDATRNKYESLIDCDVEQIGEEFSRKPFAFAVQNGSPLRSQMSQVMLELINNRVLEELTNAWWDSNELKKECPRIEDETDGISIKNIGGVFLVIVIGTVLSLIVLAAEVYYYKLHPDRQARQYRISRTARDNMNQLSSGTSLNTLTPSSIGNGSAVTLYTMDTKIENGDAPYFTYDSTSNGLTHRGYSDNNYQISRL